MTAEIVVGPTTNGHSANGSQPAVRSAEDTLPSAYLRYLPAIYWDDPFMGRFLRIFEEILSPLQTTVNRRAQQFDASLAPPVMLQFLASWVGADEFGDFPESQMRRLIKNAVLLHQLRGTKRGLRLALESVANKQPYITEYSPGLVLGEDAVLGLNTSLEQGRALQIHIVFACRESEVNVALIHDIIRRYKPAGTVYSLSFVT